MRLQTFALLLFQKQKDEESSDCFVVKVTVAHEKKDLPTTSLGELVKEVNDHDQERKRQKRAFLNSLDYKMMIDQHQREINKLRELNHTFEQIINNLGKPQ